MSGAIAHIMSSSPKAKKPVRKRYTAEEKGEVLAFAEQFNKENGRGGQKAAAAKYGISPITLSAWGKQSIQKPKRGRKAGPVSTGPEKNLSARLREIAALAAKIDRTAAELSRLKARFKSLLAAL